MPRIPKDGKKRKSLQSYWELRKIIAETQRTENELSHELALASKARVYTFYGDVDADTIRKCMDELGIWSRENPGKPITVIFNSPGGYLVDGNALYDYILHLRSQGHHVTTVALGQASSMGGVLLQAGDIRVMGPNAWLMIHETYAGIEGTVSQLREQLRQVEREDDRTTRILAERAKISFEEIVERSKKTDWYLDADEAIRLGFADEKLQPKHMTPPKKNRSRKVSADKDE